MMQFEFQAKSDSALVDKFKKLGNSADEIARNVVKTITIQILGDAQRNIKKNESNVSGQLLSSGRVYNPKLERKEISAEVRFESDHAWYLEFGRRAGRMPPIAPILQWVKKKGLGGQSSIKTKRRSDTKAQKSAQEGIAYLIARSIARKGTQPHPFFYPAISKNGKLLIDNFKQQYDEYINKILK